MLKIPYFTCRYAEVYPVVMTMFRDEYFQSVDSQLHWYAY